MNFFNRCTAWPRFCFFMASRSKAYVASKALCSVCFSRVAAAEGLGRLRITSANSLTVLTRTSFQSKKAVDTAAKACSAAS